MAAVALVGALAGIGVTATPAQAAVGDAILVSHLPLGPATMAKSSSEQPAVSADGRYVAFRSFASNLVAGQTNNASANVFLFDRVGGAVTLVSHVPGSSTSTGNGASGDPVISADGRYVAFESLATDLGQTDNNVANFEIFLFDRDAPAGTALTLVTHIPSSATSTGNVGGLDPDISDDGRYVTFDSGAADLVTGTISGQNVYLFDRLATTATAMTLVSHVPGNATTSANDGSLDAVISGDGNYVAFRSRATDLVTGSDTSDNTDLFLYARVGGAVTLVSHSHTSLTTTADRSSEQAVISTDGRYVAFRSSATDLVAGQTTNASSSVFLFDRVGGAVALVSHIPGSSTSTGNAASGDPVISADGRFVAFESAATDLGQTDNNAANFEILLFDRDAPAGTALTLVTHIPSSATSTGNVGGLDPVISDDGRYVAFGSGATDLVTGTDTPGTTDVFLFDRLATTAAALTLVSHVPGDSTTTANNHSFEPAISADGNFVAFRSQATNVVTGQADAINTTDIFLFARASGTNVAVSHIPGLTTTADASSEQPAVSDDGRYVAFRSRATDLVAGQTTNASSSVFLFDRVGGAVTLVSHVPGSATTTGNAASGDPVISADGRYVAFESAATDLGQTDNNGANFEIFLFDRDAPAGTALTLVTHIPSSATSTGNRGGLDPVISDDGRYVAFGSAATDLVTGTDTTETSDVFLFDRDASPATALSLVSRNTSSATTTGNGDSFGPVISSDGNSVVFSSRATDLVTGSDTSDNTDLFLFARVGGAVTLVSHSNTSLTTAAEDSSEQPIVSANGRYVAFRSSATDLVAAQITNASSSVFLFDRVGGAVALVSHIPGSSTTTGNAASGDPVISADGRFVAFESAATDLGQTDNNAANFEILLFDRDAPAGTALTLVTHIPSSATSTGNVGGLDPEISDDGRYVVFDSGATDLVTGTISGQNVFLFDRLATTATALTLVSHVPGSSTTSANDGSFAAVISGNGSYVAFRSSATNLVTGQNDGNLAADLFLVGQTAPEAPQADVSVTKTESPDPVVAGQNSTYTITVANSVSGSTAANVLLTDPLPTNTTFVSRVVPSGWNCAAQVAGSTGPLSCTLASLTPGDGAQVFTLVVRVNLQTPSATSISNTASVTADGDTTLAGNNVATATTTVTFAPSLPAVVRSSTNWLLRNTLSSGLPETSFTYGMRPLIPLFGDWDGNGSKTPGTFEGGTFKLNNSYDSTSDQMFTFGDPRGFPVAGDFNGDGMDDVAVFRNGNWQVRFSTGAVLPTFAFGPALTWPIVVPVAGDWNGDGIDGIGIYNAGVWSLKNTASAGSPDLAPTFAPGADPYPVVGDWNGDGIDTIGVKSRTGMLWQLSNSNNVPLANVSIDYGQANTDLPFAWR